MAELEAVGRELVPSNGEAKNVARFRPKGWCDMEFADYQEQARGTAEYPLIGHAVIYPTLGLANEAGEVAGKIKKIFRDMGGEIGDGDRRALASELGDVLWYLAQVATELGLSLDEIATSNIAKLLDRKSRGKIHGDGDNR